MQKSVADRYGKKVKINSEGVPVKSFHAIKCLIALAIVILLIVGLVVGAVFVVGDIAVKNLTNGKYSYNDVRIALNNISDYRKVEKNDLDNAFSAADADGFTGALADALFLKEIKQSDIKDIMDALADSFAEGMGKEDKGDSAGVLTSLKAILDGGEDEDEEKPKSALSEKLETLLKELFSAENIKKDKITGYDEENDDFRLRISDKSLAAFLNETVINSFFDNKNLKDTLSGTVTKSISQPLSSLGGTGGGINLDDFDYKNILQLRQLTFYSNGSGAGDRAGVKLITQTNLESILDALFKDIKGENFLRAEASGMAKFGFDSLAFIAKTIIKGLLPEKLYITVDIPVTEGDKTLISLNGTTQQDYENIMGIFAEILGGGTFKDPLEGIFGKGSAIDNAVKSINEDTPLKDSLTVTGKSGTVKLDLLNLVLNLAGVNTEEDEDGNKQRKQENLVTSKDVYLLLKTVAAPDTEAAMGDAPDYMAKTPETDTHGEFVYENGSFRYVSGDPGRGQTEINDAYQTALLDAFKKNYGLGGGITSFDELFDIISGGDRDEFISLFEYEKIDRVVNGQANGITLDSLMLSALISAQTEKFLEGGGDFDMSSVTPRFVTLYTTQHEGTAHNIMEVGIELNLASILSKMLPEGDNLMSIILNQLMDAIVSDSILIRAEIDITAGGDDFEYLPSRFAFDTLGYEKTQSLLDLLGSFAGNDSDFTAFLSEMLTPVRDMIGMMTDSLPGLSIGEDAIIMPDLYNLLATFLGDTLTASEVEQVLKGVYFDAAGNVWFDFNGGEPADMNTLIAQKIGMVELGGYILNPGSLAGGVELTTFTDGELASMISYQLQLDDSINATLSSVIILAESDVSAKAADLRLLLGEYDGESYDGSDYMIITVKLDFASLGYGGSFGGFMPDDFYVTLLYQMNGITPVFKWYRFNNMSEDTQNCLYEFIGFDNLEDVLGSGEGNIGGGYFETLASTVLNAADTAVNSAVGLIPGVIVSYYYKAADGEGSVGGLSVSIRI